MSMYRPAYERFHEKFDRLSSGCWQWNAARASNGYGIFYVGDGSRRNSVAHRWSYGHYVGEIPQGMQLDHLCRNKLCVNPDHLEPVSNGENGRRGYAFRRAGTIPVCVEGHPLTGDNLYGKPGKTRCRLCNNTKNAARNRARRIASKSP